MVRSLQLATNHHTPTGKPIGAWFAPYFRQNRIPNLFTNQTRPIGQFFWSVVLFVSISGFRDVWTLIVFQFLWNLLKQKVFLQQISLVYDCIGNCVRSTQCCDIFLKQDVPMQLGTYLKTWKACLRYRKVTLQWKRWHRRKSSSTAIKFFFSYA